MTHQTIPFVIPVSAAAYLLVIYLLLMLAQRSSRLSRPHDKTAE